MVAALIASVIAFQLNTTMLIPAIHTINEEFGLGAFATMSTYFSLAGAVSSVVHIRWSDYVGRKRVLLGVMCVSTVLYIVSMALGIMVVGRILQGGSVITFGLAFLITREHLSGPAFGTLHWSPSARRSRGFACAGSPLIRSVIQITFLRFTVREKPRLIRGSKSSVLQRK